MIYASVNNALTHSPLAMSATGSCSSSSLSARSIDGPVISDTLILTNEASRAPREWLLPVYGPLPAMLKATLNLLSPRDPAAEAFTPTYSFEDNHGLSRMDYVTNICTWESVPPDTIFVLPLRLPLPDEDADYLYLERAGLAVFLIRGRPTATTTGARLLGFHGGPGIPGVDIGDYFTLPTPGKFVMAAQELLELGLQMRDALLPTRTTTKRADTIDNDIRLDAPAEKRHRTTQQAEGGERASPGVVSLPGEKSSHVINDPEGGAYYTRIKSDLAVREQELAVLFRTTEKERWLFAMGPDYILQVREYSDMIIEQHTTRLVDREPAFATCGLLDRIIQLKICGDVQLLGQLLKGHYGGSDLEALGLEDFLPGGVRLPGGIEPCLRQNHVMVMALRNLQLVLTVYFAAAFNGSLDPFINSLEGVDRPLELAPAGFLRRMVERTLTQYFRKLRTPSIQSDLNGPTSCAAALTEAFRKLLEDSDSQSKLSEAIQRDHLVCLRESVVRGSKPPAVAAIGREAPSRSVCPYHFAGELRLINAKAAQRYACKRRPCRDEHPEVGKLTVARKRAIILTLPESLQQRCQRALEGPKKK